VTLECDALDLPLLFHGVSSILGMPPTGWRLSATSADDGLPVDVEKIIRYFPDLLGLFCQLVKVLADRGDLRTKVAATH
jgi:hypothetical protein